MKRFFIIGFQRSGTTLLDYLINEHPEIVSFCEWELICMIYRNQKERLTDIKFDSFVKCFKDHNINSENYLKLTESYFKSMISTKNFIEKAYDLGRHSDIIKAIGRKEAVSLSHYRYNFKKKLCKDFCDEYSIIFIERDIKSVINSYIKLGFIPPGKRELNDVNLKKFSNQYIKCLNNSEKYISKFAFALYITYENLMKKPERTLTKIFEFLNTEVNDSIIKRILSTHKKTNRIDFKGIQPELIEGWKKNLSSNMVDFIESYYEKKRKRSLTKSLAHV